MSDFIEIKAARAITKEEAITIAIKRHAIQHHINRARLIKEGIRGIKYIGVHGYEFLRFDEITDYTEKPLKRV